MILESDLDKYKINQRKYNVLQPDEVCEEHFYEERL